MLTLEILIKINKENTSMAKKAAQNSLISRLKLLKTNRKAQVIILILLIILISTVVMVLRKPAQVAIKSITNNSSGNSNSGEEGSTSPTPTPGTADGSSSSAASPSASPGSSPAGSGSGAAGGGSQGASSGGGSVSATPVPTPEPEPFSINPPYGQINESYMCGGGAHEFVFTASITSNGPGTITYHWYRSDGASTSPTQLVFSSATTIQVQNTWTFVGPLDYYGWQRLEVTSPFETSSKADDADFTIDSSC